MKRFLIALSVLTALAACEVAAPPTLGPDGKPLPRPHQILPGEAAKIPNRMLDSINKLREAAGLAPVQLNAQLTAAAKAHSRDMSRQDRPWHFGSDGSSPIDRVKRAGYPKMMLGENISETLETDVETLAAWMEQADTRAVILDPNATDMGIAWHQEANGRIWWTLLMGG